MDPLGRANSGNGTSELPAERKSPVRLAFRIVRWTTYIAAVITLVMVFHAAPPPAIATSSQAAAKVEQLWSKRWPTGSQLLFGWIKAS